MRKLTKDELNKGKPNPLFKGMPERLKDPKNYKKVEKELAKLLETKHDHKQPSAWMKCEECQTQFEAKRKKRKQLGFKSAAQYLEWKKIMNIIINEKSFQIK